ncbi:MAG: ubiquinone biosynthesis regulatory protein kinase UbiB [Legionellaceae bacterium]|nr:ubiquinone biosynthesis regulatory protein kinase UbiB [Legionellaceae bacterium]
MRRLKQIFRLLHINYILAKNGLDQVVVSLRLFAPLRFVMYLNPWNWFRRKQLSRGEALRKTLEELGPIFIKFGQALSTRPDLLPDDMIAELSKLQDNVPPFPVEQALAIIEEAFGQSAFDVFAEFDSTVLASASMAQVHAARLKSGEDVVVKILRPKMRKLIARDLNLLASIASLAHRYWPESRRFKPKAVVQEFQQSLLDELDLQREGANASQLRRNFDNSPLLYVPKIYWDYVRQNVLVMERIYGIPVTDMASLKSHGVCTKTLAARGVEIFFTQVFRDCFFHADMHPGNIFVSPKHLAKPQYICIDFGIMGTLTEEDKRYLAENLLAFFNRDYRRVALLHIESGWVARHTRVDEFESAIRTVCEPIFEKPLKDISFALLVLRLFQIARRFHMEVQPQLILLQKTLLAVEGLGRQLDPDLDLWLTAKPFLETWLKQQMGPRALIKNIRENLPFLIEELPHMPRLLNDVLVLSKQQQLRAREEAEQHATHAPPVSRGWFRGACMGSLITLLAIASVSYLHLFGRS